MNASFILKRLIPLFFLHMFFLSPSAFAIQFSGVVVDNNGEPVSKAIVRLQGTSFATLTDQYGRFNMAAGFTVKSKYITAWKSGYYNGGQRVSAKRNYRIVLTPVPSGDNQKYEWMRPSHKEPELSKNRAKEKTCKDCHTKDFMEQWEKSTHASSATNPLFLSFFNGTDIHGKKAAGPGYKLDFPNSNGNCAACHVPALALKNPFNADPNKAQGIEKEGVFCDLCHKIADVNTDRDGGYPGVLSIQFQRPPEGKKIFFGPYDDVFPGPDSYNPLYKDSRYCASCHNGKFWGVLAYPEFQEWAESPYAKENVHCQDCHMKPDGKITRFVLKKEGGILRNPATVYSHAFHGVRDRDFMSRAIGLETKANLEDNILRLTVEVKNVKAGHHYPTGNPMRNMLLLIDVSDESGIKLPMLRGERVPVWGGVGDVEAGNYAGLPGKGFAKVLKDLMPYPDRRIKPHFQTEYPAPHWRPAVVESDSRIAAKGSDVSVYQFQVPKAEAATIHITARLIYRRAYKSWLDAKGLEIEDMEIAREELVVKR